MVDPSPTYNPNILVITISERVMSRDWEDAFEIEGTDTLAPMNE
jgi:hypothetical protein